MIDIIIVILAILTVIANVIILLSVLAWMVSKATKRNFLAPVRPYLRKHGLVFIFIIALTATLGSLFFSNVLGYEPCILCWYQRILMYPLALLIGMALFKRSKAIIPYIIPLALVGALISTLHNIEQLKATLVPQSASVFCTSDGVSCAAKYTSQFGYVTIPMMALSAFLLILLVAIAMKDKK